VKTLLEDTYNSLDRAILYEKRGRLGDAIENYLLAARSLFRAAQLSKGELKRIRVVNAEKLLYTALSLDNRAQTARMIRSNPDFEKGLELLEELGVNLPESQNVSFDDVAGLEDVKREIRISVIEPMRNPEKAEKMGIKPGGGVLLYGPPGTGKTFIVRALAREVNGLFIEVQTSTLVNQWFGNFEKNINKLFNAVKLCAPCILFFDEIDGLVPRRRSSSSSVMKRAVPQFLQELGGMDSIQGREILVVGATNNPWDLDEAVLRPGRFNAKILVPPPDWEARKRIFELNLLDYPVERLDFDLCATLTEGYSGADIVEVCERSRKEVFMDMVEYGLDRLILMEDVTKSIGSTPKSINEKYLKKFEKFKEEMG